MAPLNLNDSLQLEGPQYFKQFQISSEEPH